MRRVLVLKLFVFVAMGLGAVLAADLGQAVAEGFLVPQEDAMHARVNEIRSSRGLDPVGNDTSLRWMARRQSQAMASVGYIFHNQDLAADADEAGLAWYTLGENVGRGDEWSRIQAAFEASPTHLGNVVNDRFDHLGVGGLADPAQTLYFTQNYAGLQAPAPPPAPPTAPPPAAAATAPPATQPPAVAPTTTPADADVEPPPDDPAEVQSADLDAEPLPRSQGTRPQRPSLLRVVLGMLLVLADKLAFWS